MKEMEDRGRRERRERERERGSKESRKGTSNCVSLPLPLLYLLLYSLTPSLCMQMETNLAAVRSLVTWLSHPEASNLPNQLELVISEGSLHAVKEGGEGGREREEERERGGEEGEGES